MPSLSPERPYTLGSAEKGKKYIYLCAYLFLGGRGHACSMQKFPGQESNPHHSSDLSHCNDNTRSLTYCTTRDILRCNFNYRFYLIWYIQNATISTFLLWEQREAGKQYKQESLFRLLMNLIPNLFSFWREERLSQPLSRSLLVDSMNNRP